ncbi:uncharacterized protein LOC143183931 [Calliopsis andreniformis]|uniref:uncharacterized protein LOC143183931 n=1 Tax=Calliopsis andreniformis TaxID=337506 RepID=UPI003FCE04CB
MMIQDEEEDESEKNKKEQKAVEMENRRAAMLMRSDNKRRLRQMHLERKETTEAEKLQRIKEASELKVRQFDLTQRLAKELALRKHYELQEEIKKTKARSKVPLLSSSDVELLQTRLIEEKKREKELESLKLFDIWHMNEDLNKKKREENKLKYKKDLQSQMIDNRRRQREEEEEKHRERKIMEQVGETIMKEDLKAEKYKKKIALLLQAEKDAFLKARQFWKDKRREVLKQEHEETSRILLEKETLHRQEVEKKSDISAVKEAMVDKLAKQLKEEERKKLEREDICRELYLAEKESELTNKAIKLALDKKHSAKELLQDMVRHQKVIAEKKAKEDAIDAAFAQYLAEEQRNVDEKEKRKEQARREKMMQYGMELRETIRRNQMQYSRNVPRKSEATNEGHFDKNESVAICT